MARACILAQVSQAGTISMSRLFVLSQTGALSGALSHRHVPCQAQDEDLLAHDSVGL